MGFHSLHISSHPESHPKLAGISPSSHFHDSNFVLPIYIISFKRILEQCMCKAGYTPLYTYLSLSLCLHRLRLVTRSSSALVNYTPMPCRIFPTVKTVRSIAMTRYKQALLRMLAVLGCRCQFGADTPSNWIPKFLSCSVWVPRALSPDLPLEPQRPCLGRSHCSPQKSSILFDPAACVPS